MAEFCFENVSGEVIPDEAYLETCAAVVAADEGGGVSVRVVSEVESAALNLTYRGKSGPTNILSFPTELPPGVPVTWLGDLVICASVVRREAQQQKKSLEAHWAHMMIHGMLHLQGYDHLEEKEARVMEAREVTLLKRLGHPDPYEEVITAS